MQSVHKEKRNWIIPLILLITVFAAGLVVLIVLLTQSSSTTDVFTKDGHVIEIYPSSEQDVVRDPDTRIEYIRNEILVVAGRGVSRDAVERAAAPYGGKIVGQNSYLSQYQLQFQKGFASLDEMESTMATFLETGLFQDVYPNYYTSFSIAGYSPNDEHWVKWEETMERHWGQDAVRAPEMWALLRTVPTETVSVGVYDKSFHTVPDELEYAGIYQNNPDLRDEQNMLDIHGTHVSGIIGANHDNGRGISGIATNVRLYASAYDVENGTDAAGNTVCKEQAALTYFICVHECKVINISMAYDEDYQQAGFTREQFEAGEFLSSIKSQAQHSCPIIIRTLNFFLDECGLDFVIVTAAGNNNDKPGKIIDAQYANIFSAIEEPRIKNRIIVVGNAERRDGSYGVAQDSCCGRRVDLLAPGTYILSTATKDHGYYAFYSGTSMASPFVAGTAAAMWSVNPGLTGADVKKIILDTAKGSYGYAEGEYYRPDTYPLLDCFAAVNKALHTDQSVENWQDAYGDFIKNQMFLQLDQPYYDLDEVLVTLFDFDDDFVPELLIYNGAADADPSMTYVYTYKYQSVFYVGRAGAGWDPITNKYVGFTLAPNSIYFSIDRNDATDIKRCYRNEDGVIASETAPIVWQFSPEETLRWYSLRQIDEIGWKKFVHAPFTGGFLEVEYSVSDEYTPGEPIQVKLDVLSGTGPYRVTYILESQTETDDEDVVYTTILSGEQTLPADDPHFLLTIPAESSWDLVFVTLYAVDYYGVDSGDHAFVEQIFRKSESSRIPLYTETFEVKQDGYTIEVELRYSPWILQSNRDQLTSAWRQLGQKGELPTMDQGWNFEKYAGNLYWHRNSYVVNFSCKMNDMCYLLGTITLKNVTEGWPITKDRPVDVTSVWFLLQSDAKRYTEYRDEREYSIFKIFYKTPKVTSGIGDLYPHMTGDKWGPVGFVVGIPEYFSPNTPYGTSQDILADAALYFGEEHVFPISTELLSAELCRVPE